MKGAALPVALVTWVVVVSVAIAIGSADAFNMTLVHTADTQSAVTAMDLFGNPCAPFNITSYLTPAGDACLGGVARLKTVVDAVRARSANVLLMDAGDILQSSLFFYLFGPSVVANYYAELGYDFVQWQVIDFVAYVPNVVGFMLATANAGANVTYVTSNLVGFDVDPRVNGTVVLPYGVKAFANGERVGFIGTMRAGVRAMIAFPNLIDSTDEIHALSIAVASLQNLGVDKIVASVSGNATAELALNGVPGIDVLVVPGQLQSNGPMPPFAIGSYPAVFHTPWLQPVLVVSSGSFGQAVGVLDVEFDMYGVLTSWSGDAVPLDDNVTPDSMLQTRVLNQYAEIQARYSLVVGYSAVDLAFQTACLFAECTFGDWAADAIRAAGGTQVGFTNAGAIRAGIPAGFVTLGQEQTALPFGSAMHYTYALAGKYLLAALENAVSLANDQSLTVNDGAGRFLQVSGLWFSWNPNEAVGWRIVDARVETAPGQWEPVDPTTNYTVSSFDWIVVLGGDGYTVVQQNAFDLFGTGIGFNALFLSAFAHNVTAVEQGRITVTSATRRACLAPDGSVCNDNGRCVSGACVCTKVDATGTLCHLDTSSNGGGNSLSSGVLVSVILVPLLALLLVALCIIGIVVATTVRARRAEPEDWRIDYDDLTLGCVLGQGGFGIVHKAVWKNSEVAVKTIPPDVSREARRNFEMEVRVMSRLRHPNVVLFMAASIRPPKMCIVMEFMALGSLYDLIHNELVPKLPLALVTKLVLQAAKGMHFLHSSGVVHRDLKSLNLLLDSKWNIKVADFGLTCLRDEVRNRQHHAVGSVHWMAPEVLEERPEVEYMLADVYSFGIVLWELFTREQPYDGLLPAQIAVGVIRHGMRPRVVHAQNTDEARYLDLAQACWRADPTSRPTFTEITMQLDRDQHADCDRSHVASTRSSSSSATCASYVSTAATLLSSSASGVADATPLYRHQSVPRHDVSYAVCDLACMDDVWLRDASDADRLIEAYGRAVRRHLPVAGAYVFSRSVLHSGGTYLVAFVHPQQAADFALGLRTDIESHADGLAALSRVALHYMPGANPALEKDRPHATYRPSNYEQACAAAVRCRPGVVLCTLAFAEAFETVSTGTHRLRALKDGMHFALLASADDDNDDRQDRGDDDNGDDDNGDDNGGNRDMICSSNACPWIIGGRRIVVGERIGEGSYGQVSRGVCIGSPVAVKRLNNPRLGDECMRRMRLEAALLSGLDHPNIVKLVGLCLDDDELALVMELVTGGSLADLLANTVRRLSWSDRVGMLRDTALGIAFLHGQGIAHRDIKSSNLLVDADTLVVKVGDFGFATARLANATVTRCGTPCWTAPEILCPPEPDATDADADEDDGMLRNRLTKADVYSFGIVMWEVLTRKKPYIGGAGGSVDGMPQHGLVHLVAEVLGGGRPPVPADCNPAFARLMTRCWHHDPRKRPDMDEVVRRLNALGQGVDA